MVWRFIPPKLLIALMRFPRLGVAFETKIAHELTQCISMTCTMHGMWCLIAGDQIAEACKCTYAYV